MDGAGQPRARKYIKETYPVGQGAARAAADSPTGSFPWSSVLIGALR